MIFFEYLSKFFLLSAVYFQRASWRHNSPWMTVCQIKCHQFLEGTLLNTFLHVPLPPGVGLSGMQFPRPQSLSLLCECPAARRLGQWHWFPAPELPSLWGWAPPLAAPLSSPSLHFLLHPWLSLLGWHLHHRLSVK